MSDALPLGPLNTLPPGVALRLDCPSLTLTEAVSEMESPILDSLRVLPGPLISRARLLRRGGSGGEYSSSEVVAIDSSSGSISSPSGRTGAAMTSPLPCEEEEMTKGVVEE